MPRRFIMAIDSDAGTEFEDEKLAPPPPPHGFEHFVRENPIAAVFGALIAGVVLGRLGIL
jgi:hypothetical protein